MTMNSPGPHSSEDTNENSVPLADPQLDELLLSAVWPECSTDVTQRLQSCWKNARSESPSSKPFGTTSTSTEETPNIPVQLSQEPHRTRSAMRSTRNALAITAVVLLAFAIGRLTASGKALIVDSPDSTEVKPPETEVSNDVAEQPKGSQSSLAETEGGMNTDTNSMTDERPVVHQDQIFKPEDPIAPVPDALKLDEQQKTRMTAAQRRQRQLEAVLACLGDNEEKNVACCRELMPRRHEFEYLLWQIVENTTGQRQLSAITALGFIGTDRSVPGLLQIASRQELRTSSLEALRRVGDDQTLVMFIRQQQQPELAIEFARELISRNSPQFADTWVQLVEDRLSRQICLKLVDEIPEAQLNAIALKMESPRVMDRIAAAVIVGQRTDKATHEKLRQWVEQKPSWEPVAALIWNGSDEAMKTLKTLEKRPGSYAIIQTASIQLNAFTTSSH